MWRLWVVALLLVGCVSTVPLPSNVNVIPPAGVPNPVAAYSGKWQGVWDDTLDHILVVEEIKGTEAMVIYAWGDSAAWQTSRGFRRVKGTFEGNMLVVKLPRPATVTYQMRPDGKLDAKYDWQGGIARAILTKMAESR